MNMSELEKTLKDIIENSNIENDSDYEIVNKLQNNPEFKKILSDKNNPIIKSILEQSKVLFQNLDSKNDIIESNFCFFGKTEDKNKLILSLKIPQLIVDKYTLLEIIKDLRTTIDYLESQEKNE